MKRVIVIALFMGFFISVVPEKEINAVTCDYRNVQVCIGILNPCLTYAVDKYRESNHIKYGETVTLCRKLYDLCIISACPAEA